MATHGSQMRTADYTLTAGLHGIEIIQHEHGVNTLLSAFMDSSTLSQSVLSTTSAIPEPASWSR